MKVEDMLLQTITKGLSISQSKYKQLSAQLDIINFIRFLICALVFPSPFIALFVYVLSGMIITNLYSDQHSYLYGKAFMIGQSQDLLKGLKKAAEEMEKKE